MGCGAGAIKSVGASALDVVIQMPDATPSFRSKPPNDQCDWMANIPDDKNICDMWIPGTHDTMSRDCVEAALTQEWTLTEQLQSGIRFLDIRVKWDEDKLQNCHGETVLKTDMKNVVEDIEKFLQEHPKEVIFMLLKKDDDAGKHSDAKLDDCLHKYIKAADPDEKLWNWNLQKWGTLGEHRGKCTFVPYTSNLELYTTPEFDAQNDYDLGDPEEKAKKIIEHTGKEHSANKMFIDFCSAVKIDALPPVAPCNMAVAVNKKIMDSKDTLKPGIFVFDFPGDQLVKGIIARNQ